MMLQITFVSEVKQDKNGKDYKVVKLSRPAEAQESTNPLTGKPNKIIITGSRSATLVAYEDPEYPNQKDALFYAEPGDMTDGTIYTEDISAMKVTRKDGSLVSSRLNVKFAEVKEEDTLVIATKVEGTEAKENESFSQEVEVDEVESVSAEELAALKGLEEAF